MGLLGENEQVAAVTADADAGGVDERCVVGAFVFHCEIPLFVSGFGPMPFLERS